eukprot:5392477-Amphidinium_carterae.1
MAIEEACISSVVAQELNDHTLNWQETAQHFDMSLEEGYECGLVPAAAVARHEPMQDSAVRSLDHE